MKNLIFILIIKIIILIKINECNNNEIETIKKQIKNLQNDVKEIGVSMQNKINDLDKKIEEGIFLDFNFFILNVIIVHISN
jgi:predicted phage-related endonuclease